MRDLAEVIAGRIEAEVLPLCMVEKYEGGYDCCGCNTYVAIVEHAARIAREVGESWNR